MGARGPGKLPFAAPVWVWAGWWRGEGVWVVQGIGEGRGRFHAHWARVGTEMQGARKQTAATPEATNQWAGKELWRMSF